MTFKRSSCRRDKRPYTDHLGSELSDELKIFDDVGNGLAGRTDHEAAAGLIADFFQRIQTPQAICGIYFFRMETPVVGRIGGFVTQKISVGACVKELLIAFTASFADGQGDGAVGVSGFNCGDQAAEPVVVPVGILSALQDEGAKYLNGILRRSTAESALPSAGNG